MSGGSWERFVLLFFNINLKDHKEVPLIITIPKDVKFVPPLLSNPPRERWAAVLGNH